MINYKDEILNIIKLHPKAYGHILNSKKYKYLVDWLHAKYPILVKNENNLNTFLYWLINDIDDFPKCQNCGKPIIANAYSPYKYVNHCSRTCAAVDKTTLEKTHQTNLQRYGVECTFQTEKSWNAIHKSCKEKYGNENIWATEYGKQLCKKSRFEKYGKFESDESKIKRKNTIIEKYGGTTGNIFGTEYGKNKIKQTIFKKTGHIYQNQRECDRIRLSKLMKGEEMQLKRNQTLHKNNSFNTSNAEDTCYLMLLFIYPHLIRQYKSNEYPFNCDFYDPDKNIFFEYNGSWVHGGHFFNENDIADIDKLNYWKSKNTDYYNNAIKVWTQSDILKKRIAETNKLKYIVFWNIKDVEEYIINYKFM